MRRTMRLRRSGVKRSVAWRRRVPPRPQPRQSPLRPQNRLVGIRIRPGCSRNITHLNNVGRSATRKSSRRNRPETFGDVAAKTKPANVQGTVRKKNCRDRRCTPRSLCWTSVPSRRRLRRRRAPPFTSCCPAWSSSWDGPVLGFRRRSPCPTRCFRSTLAGSSVPPDARRLRLFISSRVVFARSRAEDAPLPHGVSSVRGLGAPTRALPPAPPPPQCGWPRSAPALR
jgi:hypothetical protein